MNDNPKPLTQNKMVNIIAIARRNKAARIIRETERRAGRRLSGEERLNIAKKQGVRTSRQLELGLRATSQKTTVTGGRGETVTRAATTGAFAARARQKEVSARAKATTQRIESQKQRVQKLQEEVRVRQQPSGLGLSPLAAQRERVRPVTGLPPTTQQVLQVPAQQRSPVFTQAPSVQRILELEIARGIGGSPGFQRLAERRQQAQRQKLTAPVTGGAVIPFGGRQAVFENIIVAPLSVSGRAELITSQQQREQAIVGRRERLAQERTAEERSRQIEAGPRFGIGPVTRTIREAPLRTQQFQARAVGLQKRASVAFKRGRIGEAIKAQTGSILAGQAVGAGNVIQFTAKKPLLAVALTAGPAVLVRGAGLLGGGTAAAFSRRALALGFGGVAIGAAGARAATDPFFRTPAGVAAFGQEAGTFALASGAE